MKQIYLIIILFSVIIQSCNTTKKMNKIIYCQSANQHILIGKVNRKGLTKKQIGDWFTKEYNNFTPNAPTIAELKKYNFDKSKIIVILGTWCSDSQREVPRLYKILDEIKFNEDSLIIYAVDKQKLIPEIDLSEFNIERVPTIIYYYGNSEKARIIETPNRTIESDLLEFTQIK